MNVSEAQHIYLSLKYSYRAGNMTEEQFIEKVQQLRVQAPDESWWQLQYDGTGWLHWNGSAWVKERLPAAMMSLAAKDTAERSTVISQTPASFQSLSQYFSFLFSEMKKNLLQKISLIVIVFAVVWALNTYLAMRYNIPWWGQVSEFLANLLAARGGLLWRALLWFLLSTVVVGVYVRLRQEGFKRFSQELSQIPIQLKDTLNRSGQAAVPMMLGSGAFALLLCTLANIRLFSLLVFLVLILNLSRGGKSGLFLVSSLFWSDLGKFLKRDLPSFDREKALILFSGFALGALLVFFLPLLPQAGYYTFLLLVVIFIIFVAVKKKDSVRHV